MSVSNVKTLCFDTGGTILFVASFHELTEQFGA
jgi:hypothetical protein